MMLAGRQAAVAAVLSLALATWLGYALGRGQSLSEVARLYRDQATDRHTIDTGALVAEFARMGGDLKPLLRAPDGTALMNYSDWDYNAVVIVDGQRYDAVRLAPTAAVDYARNRIVAGLSAGDWVLSREVTLAGDRATVQFIFVANTPVHEVRVTIAHVNWYFLKVDVGSSGFTATVARATRSEIETGLVRAPSYQVEVKATSYGEPISEAVRIGLSTPFGIQSIVTQYLLREPKVGEYTPLGLEQVTYSRI